MMLRALVLATASLFVFVNCGGPANEAAVPPKETPKDLAKENPKAATQTPPKSADADAAAAAGKTQTMDEAIAALMAKPELADEAITVEHVLIAFQGAPRITGVTRSLPEAKTLAEQIWQRAIAGEDFSKLRKEFSNDSGPGVYPMTKAGRAGMVAGFGNVGFRLRVGEIGVAPYDKAASPYGYHVIKRVK